MTSDPTVSRSSTPLSADGAPDGGPPSAGTGGELRAAGRQHFERVSGTSDAFFREQADEISEACWDMARRFHRDGRLLVFAPEGPARSDAFHVSVEFVHPVLVGKRALPAVSLEGTFADRVRTLGRPEDIALGISSPGTGEEIAAGLTAARDAGLLTVGLAAGDGSSVAELDLDHRFVVPSGDPAVVQEVQETLYHVLWELVHVFFDHEALL